MKKKFYNSLLLLTFLFLYITSAGLAQFPGNEIADGKEYWFGLPHCMRSSDESVRWGIYPIELWLSSKVDTKATIEALDGSLQPITVSLRKNDIVQVSLPDNLENRESEIVRNFGIHIYSNDPISVGVFEAYEWSGEAFRVIPKEWLGKEYFTLNMYQDYTKMHDGQMDYKPAQIVICATEDNTQVQYTPTAETEKGVKPGQIARVNLNKGQTFLIKAKIFPNLNQDWSTDLTGTHIVATKPISVISGHTKGAFPRYPGTMYGLKTDFLRNMLAESMWPVELLGTEYISAPLKFKNRTIFYVIPDDIGDIIRFVATEDNTLIYQMRQDGSSLKQISPVLKKGEWYDILNQTDAAFYKSNKKVLVGHYGKGWISNLPPPKPGEEEIQNPSQCGQGLLLTLTPIERWCSFASFRAPANMLNLIYLTFREADAEKIIYDGQSIASRFGNAIKPINGTPYCYLIQDIAHGNHYIEAEDDNARFAGYAYGFIDAYKQGFAYGYPIGMNYADDCNDSLLVEYTVDCGDVVGKINAIDLQEDTTCAALFSVVFRVSESANYHWEGDDKFKIGNTEYDFKINLINKGDSAVAVINVLSKSGKFSRKEIKYVPEMIEIDKQGIDFGRMIPPQEECESFVIKNPGSVPMTVHDLYLKLKRTEFSINVELPFTLEPNEEKEIEVCANATVVSNQAIRDTIVAVLTCYEKTLLGLQFRTTEPIVYIYDADWGVVPLNEEKMKNVEIKNTSNTDVEIYTIEWEDHTHFTRVERLDLPLLIPAGESHEFSAYYKPDVAGVQHKDRAIFTCNANKDKLYSDWTGIGADASPLIEGYDWARRRVIDEFAGTNEYEGKVIISSTGSDELNVMSLTIEDNEDGVFRIASDVPLKLQPDKPVELVAYFAPQDEAVYDREIKLVGRFSNIEKEVSARLQGVGLRPHIDVLGHNFGEKILVGKSKSGAGKLLHNNIKPDFAMQLTIFDLTIEGEDASSFAIDQQWLAKNSFPIIIPIGEDIDVPISFNPLRPGEHNARLVAQSDAPAEENHIGELFALAYTEGLVTTDYEFEKIFIHTSSNGSVSLQNIGSEAVTITRGIQESKIATSGNSIDLQEFKITGWHSDDGLINNDAAPFELQPNATLTVDITFTPVEERNEAIHSIDIEYQSSIGNETSHIRGYAMVLKTVVEIPKGYKANPGDLLNIDFNYNTKSEEKKPIVQGDITSFTAYVYFKTSDNQEIEVFPDVENGCVDITTSGTMTDGWQCEGVNIIGRNTLAVKMSGTSPLAGSGTLFRFRMNAYLSSKNDLIPLPCGFVQNRPYVLVDSIAGDIQIAPVCVNTLRLIQLSGVEYSISQPAPNPATYSTSIEYAVGLEAQTSISLYNANGQKVASFVDEVLKPGYYHLTINVNELGLSNGTYFYKFESGPYSDTKQLIIAK